MPLTVRVGLAKDINLPDGNLRVLCNIEVEIDSGALMDVENFDGTVEQAYTICRHAIDGEIERRGEAKHCTTTTQQIRMTWST